MHVVHTEARQERTYSTAEIAKKLNIAPETIRKYNTLFYAHNIRFTKVKGKIRYSDKDLQLMKQLQELHSLSGKALTECVAEVVKQTTHDISVIQLPSTQPSQPTVELQQLQQHIERISAKQQQFQEEIQELKTYIDEKLEKRDSELMNLIREIQDQKRIILETKNKKKWWQFWRK
ncbi:DUF3967 domain-containing protein [Bacillus sp. NPDC077411]|uniref:DUF3967 domain-containing protein n=1 Tax=Bacillus sp. NPDC077411 TaxID=3363947 RepID=UPI0037CC8A74